MKVTCVGVLGFDVHSSDDFNKVTWLFLTHLSSCVDQVTHPDDAIVYDFLKNTINMRDFQKNDNLFLLY